MKVGNKVMKKFEIEEIKTVADLYYHQFFADYHVLSTLNEMITGDQDPENQPIYSVGYDYYDNSLEINFGPHIPLDYLVTEELRRFVIDECGFNQAWFNFLDGTEQYISKRIESRKLPSYDKNRIERYIKEHGADSDSDVFKKWKDYKYIKPITPLFPNEMEYPTLNSFEKSPIGDGLPPE